MGSSSGPEFFKKVENRLLTTLLLAVAYPILSAGFFAAFVFLIVPPSTASNTAGSYPWLYIYWLVAAGTWLILLAAILPLMRGDISDEGPTSRDINYDIDLKRMTARGSCDLLSDLERGEPGSRSQSSDSTDSSRKRPESLEKDLINKTHQEQDNHDLDSDKDDLDAEKCVDLEMKKSLSDLELKFVVEQSEAVVHSPKIDDNDDNYPVRRYDGDDNRPVGYNDDDNCSAKGEEDDLPYRIFTTLKTEKDLSNEKLTIDMPEKEGKIEESSFEQATNQPLEANDEIAKNAVPKTMTEQFEKSVVKTSEVVHESHEYSLPSPSAISGSGTPNKNTVFIFVNKDNDV